MKAPDAIEPVVGWRAWRVARGADGLVLVSAVYDEVWPAGEELVALCHKRRECQAPAPGCTCGIYAGGALEAEKHRVGRDERGILGRAVGEVALWGRVVEGRYGWRAERAYPVRLWVRDPELVDGLARYGVPTALEPEPASTRWPRPLSFAR
jgi:hypothetical protein